MKIVKKYYLLLVFLLCSLFSLAQRNKVDSLLSVLKTSHEDTTKVQVLYKLGGAMRKISSYDSAAGYCIQSIALADKLKYKRGGANAYNNGGAVYFEQGNYPEAVKYYLTSKKLSEESGDFSSLSNACNNLGIIYKELKDYERALSNYDQALQIRKKLNNLKGICSSYNNIGNVYELQGKHSEALQTFSLAIEFSKKANDPLSQSQLLNNIGAVYEETKEYDKALQNYAEAFRIKNEINDILGGAIALFNIGSIYRKQGHLTLSSRYLHNALDIFKRIGSKSGIMEGYKGLSQLDSASSNMKSAFENYKLYIAYRDSISNEENTKKTVRLEMQYEFDKKEAQTKAEQDKKDAIAQAEKKKQQVIMLSVVGGLAVVLIFSLFIYRSLLQIKKKNKEITEQKKKIEEKQKEILDSIRYAKRIQDAILPREKYISETLKRLMKK